MLRAWLTRSPMACNTGRRTSKEESRSIRGEEKLSAGISQAATASSASACYRHRPRLVIWSKWGCWIWVPSKANCQENRERAAELVKLLETIRGEPVLPCVRFISCLTNSTHATTRQSPVRFSMIRYVDTTMIFILVEGPLPSRGVWCAGGAQWSASLCC